MKKILSISAMGLLALGAAAQEKGRFETYDFDDFRLHVYYTNDALGDASYIIEGRDALVTLEQPLFKDNMVEYDAFLTKLDKPVVQRIADYHLGGTGFNPVIMAEGMPDFTGRGVYADMMSGFANGFGDAIAPLPAGKKIEVAFGSTQTYAGVPFTFYHGAANDFPGASILIGDKIWFTHWTPLKAHVSHLHISSQAGIDAQIAASEESLRSGAELFIGGHGGASDRASVKFKISYLKKMRKLLASNKTETSFIEAMKRAYPDLPGEENLKDLAKALYDDK